MSPRNTSAANRAAQAAVERDRSDALGLAIYGHTQSYFEKNYTVAQDILDRALAAGPSCSWAHTFSSFTTGYLGDHATSLARAEQAVRLSPLGPDAYYHEHGVSQALYFGRFDEAAAWGRVTRALRHACAEPALPDRQPCRHRQPRGGARGRAQVIAS